MTTAAIPARQATLLVAFMWFAYFLNYADRQAASAMFPSLKLDLAMTDKQLGLISAVFLWVYAFCCPIAGQLGDRFSKRVLVVLSLVVWSIVTVATGFAMSAMMMLSLRAAMGISESLYMPTAIALTANAHAPEHRSRAIATLTTAQIAGIVAGSWFGGWMADRGQWRGAFFVLGAVGVLYALPYFMFLLRVDEPAQAASAKAGASLAVAALIKVRTFLLLCVVFPVFVFGLWLMYGWLPTFLHDKFSLNQADAGIYATAFVQSTSAISLIGGGFLADKMYRRSNAARLWLMVASLLLCAPCLHAIGSSDTLAKTCIASALFGLFAGLLMGNIFPAAFEVVPIHTRSSAVGLLNFCGGIISGFATLFGGLWKQSLGIDRLLTLTALAYVIAGLALIIGINVLLPHDYERNH